MRELKKRVIRVRPDAMGRISLGALGRGVSSFTLHEEADGSLTLTPNVEIPMRELWVSRNKAVRSSLRKGLKEAAEGKLKSLGSFSKYIKK